MSDDDRAIVDAMTKFGGSFVKKLAELARVADELNVATIKNSFSVYWEHYERMAARDVTVRAAQADTANTFQWEGK